MGNRAVKPILSENDVEGLAMLDKILYVLAKTKNADIIPYEYDRCFVGKDEWDRIDGAIEIPGLGKSGKNDMIECEEEKCLFVSDGENTCIHRVEPKSKKVSKLTDLQFVPVGLSMTTKGNLLVTCVPDRLLELNVKTGKIVKEFQLPSDIQNPTHAVKRTDKEKDKLVEKYVVSHQVNPGLHRVCLVNAVDGTYRHCFGGTSGNGHLQLKAPAYLALCENNYVLVADNDNNRLVLLDPMLEFKMILQDTETFKAPHRLYVDADSQRGFVGQGTGSGKITFYSLPDLPEMPVKPPRQAVYLDDVDPPPPPVPRSKGPVDGLAVVDGKLYVLRRRQKEQLWSYDADDSDNFTQTAERITIGGFDANSHSDMTSCAKEKCLFISHADGNSILKFELATKTSKRFANLPLRPISLSMTYDGNLLVTCETAVLIEIDAKTGKQVDKLQLPSTVRFPKHALKRRDGQYIICYALEDGVHRVCVVHNVDGNLRHRSEEMKGSGHLEFKTPCYMALMDNDQVLVADSDNKRVVLLGYSLQFITDFVQKIKEPHRLCVDSGSKRLYVGAGTPSGAVKAFDI